MTLPSPTATPGASALRDRVVLITGATGGMGAPLARACAQAGATVVLHARVVRKLEALYDEIVAAQGPQPIILPLDLGHAEARDFADTASAVQAQLGRLDAVVHCAAQLGALAPFEHQAFPSWQSVFRVNVTAAAGLTRAMMALLNASPDASVVFTLDHRGETPRAYWGPYAASKAALTALARELADEWENRPGLRINAIVPGPINSPLRMQTHPGEDRSQLPRADALVPLYLHLLGGQRKDESGALIDAQAWLRGEDCVSALRK